MKLNQLSLSFTSDEISRAIKTAVSRAGSANAQIPPELSDLDICIKNGDLVVSIKKKIGFMPVTISAALGLRPTANLDGIVVTLKKISAGPIGSQAIASQIMGEVGRTLTGIPGCTVVGNDISVTKAILAAKVPWLAVPGKVSVFGIKGNVLEISIG